MHCASYRGVWLHGVHHTADSVSALCITPWCHENKVTEKTPRCASHCRVKLCSVHPSAESSSAPWSQKLAKCLFWSEILRLLFLCDALRNYYEIYTASQKLFKKSFLLQTDVTNSKARKQTFSKKSDSDSGVCIIQQSQASRCASHRGVKLHSAESNCTPRSQNRKFHWSLAAFKGTIMRDPFRGEHFYQKRKDLMYKKWFYLT